MNSRLARVALGICSIGVLHTPSVPAEENAEGELVEDSADESTSEDSSEGEAGADATQKDDEPADGGQETEAAKGEDNDHEDASGDNSPREAAGVKYQFVGVRWRMQVVPKFIQNAFGSEGGRTMISQGFGPEFAIRKDDFETIISLWWAEYNLEDTLYKGKGEEETELEVINSSLSVVYATADFLWSAPVSETFSFNFGAGLGVGIVLGELERTEAYPDASGTLEGPNGGTFSKCIGPGNPILPPGGESWCDAGGSYGPEPTWFGGGSTPALFPWFALNTGVRIKPHRRFALRVDLGFALPALFFVGLGGQYGL